MEPCGIKRKLEPDSRSGYNIINNTQGHGEGVASESSLSKKAPEDFLKRRNEIEYPNYQNPSEMDQ